MNKHIENATIFIRRSARILREAHTFTIELAGLVLLLLLIAKVVNAHLAK